MPRQLEAMKDVVVCDKPGEGDKQPLYPGISEWGTPARVIPSHLVRGANQGN